MAKKIKNVLTSKKGVTVYGTKTAIIEESKLGPVSRGTFVQIVDIETIDRDALAPKIIVRGKYNVVDISVQRAPFTNKVKRLARDKQNKKQ